MSTKMAEADWSVALEVFRASLPRRGDKGRDDRLFLEAMHYFSVHNITWRALPERFGKWNSVWKRFDRLSRSGVFETFFDHLAALSSSAHLVQMFDSTIVRAHVSAAGAKGGRRVRRSAARAAVADKGYASKANRQAARSRGIIPVIPRKANERSRPGFCAKAIYKGRARIEQAVGKLKRFKRVALRCEKTKRNFTSIVALAAGFTLVKSVHTA